MYDFVLEEKLLVEIEVDKKVREVVKFRVKVGKGKIILKVKLKVIGVKYLNFFCFLCVLVVMLIILMYIFFLFCVDMVLVFVKF